MSNRLATATSPYLLQHAENPVHWWQWSDEAFAAARERDVPVFLSVGYSACHWCHVMAHESFEDKATAAYLNEHFVSIKVDREERPDVDAVYMDATVAMTGHGGWPMSAFLTPVGEPFFCGTYFPSEPRAGMASFRQVLEALTDAWRTKRDEISGIGGSVVSQLAGRHGAMAGSGYDAGALDAAVTALGRDFDPLDGGFGAAPKFPPSMVLDFLLRHHRRTRSEDALRMVAHTCERMARGGMYDQLAGGFARYSVDGQWVVPHFEKMLYDNALLLDVYTHWWALGGDPLARRVATETADFLLRELRTAEGGFASALDADTEGAEGKYYVWTPAELEAGLGADDARWVAELCDVTPAGTFEHGASVLQLRRDPDDPERWQRVRQTLLAQRAERTRPARDDKVVAAWNGLAITALARAGVLLEQPSYVEAAVAAGTLVRDLHLDDDPAPADLPRRQCRQRRGRARGPCGLRERLPGIARSHRRRVLARPRGSPAGPGARALRCRGHLLRHRGRRGTAGVAAAGPDRQRHPVRRRTGRRGVDDVRRGDGIRAAPCRRGSGAGSDVRAGREGAAVRRPRARGGRDAADRTAGDRGRRRRTRAVAGGSRRGALGECGGGRRAGYRGAVDGGPDTGRRAARGVRVP